MPRWIHTGCQAGGPACGKQDSCRIFLAIFHTVCFKKTKIYLEYTPFINLCYTDCMQKDRSFWPEWAHLLQQSGLAEIVASLLCSAGPLNMFLAQVLYAGRPFIGDMVTNERFDALVQIFENQEESRSFAAFIREESSG